MSQQTITIAIADDHVLFRECMVTEIESSGTFKVVLQAGNGEDLITQLESRPSLPDICLLDISMPIMNGYITMKAIKKQWPDLKVLAISMFDTEFAVLKMLRFGAVGFVDKNSSTTGHLKNALSFVHEKGFYLSEAVDKKAINALNNNDKSIPNITEPEMIFLRYSCLDLTYNQIGQKMNVSKRTIEGYRDSLFAKLDIGSRTTLALFAIRNGLVHIEERNSILA